MNDIYILCPACGESELEHRNMDIYECPECGVMTALDDLADYYG